MSQLVEIKGNLDLGLFRTYAGGATFQRVPQFQLPLAYPSSSIRYNYQNLLTSSVIPQRNIIPGYSSDPNSFNYNETLRTHWGIYVITAIVGNIVYPYFRGFAESLELSSGVVPPDKPSIRIDSGSSTVIYFWYWFDSYVSEAHWYKHVTYTSYAHEKPNYKNLITGYPFDTKSFPDLNPKIIPTVTEEVKIGYYRHNYLEPIAGLTSIDWVTHNISLKKGIGYYLYLKGCVLGTLYIISGSNQLIELLTNLPEVSGRHSYSVLLPESIASIFADWNAIDNQINIDTPSNFIEDVTTTGTEINRELNKLSANNDWWKNDSSNLDDINPSRFELDNDQAYNWHIKPQIDGSYGNLVMDSPRIVDIHKALEAAKYAVNELDNTKDRVATLGHYVEKTSYLLGYRPEADGTFDSAKEKKLVRQVVPDQQRLDPKKIGINNFGEDGMVVKRITNRFKKDEVVSDQCVIIRDIPQLIQEYFEESNIALGIQESSAVEIKQKSSTARFNNQLEILVELVNLMSSGNEMIRAALVSSLVSQSQSSEIIAALGLPSVTKTIPIEIDEKVLHVPYKGIAAHRSISQEIATCTYNVGIAVGQLI